MKTKLILSMLTLAVVFTACKKENPEVVNTVITATITELDAQAATFLPNPPPAPPTITGDYTKFSFAEGTVVEGDDWDIAFRSTSIVFNGGVASDSSQPDRIGNAAAYLIDGTMEDISSVNESLLLQDAAISTAIIDDMGIQQMGWSVYDFNTNLISPIAGKILVIRTHDNKYAKIEILNFYDAAFSNVYGGFYTFNYVYQSEAVNLTF
ncbi:MAG: HmuY family protein [Flavobacteriales bacterium]|nr:HmuY family protein [Flavobacteriales bacterium]